MFFFKKDKKDQKKDEQLNEEIYKNDPEFIEKRDRLIDWVKSNGKKAPTLSSGSFKRDGRLIMEKQVVGDKVFLGGGDFDSLTDDEIAVGMILMRENDILAGNENKPVEFFGSDHVFERVKRIAIGAGIEVVRIPHPKNCPTFGQGVHGQ